MADIKSLLRKAADGYAPALGELNSHINDKAFTKGSYFSEARLTGKNSYKSVRDAMIDEGTILFDDGTERTALAMLRGGAGGMTPVILLAIIEGDLVLLGAYSKEGLIRQHAAKRAIESFKEKLS